MSYFKMLAIILGLVACGAPALATDTNQGSAATTGLAGVFENPARTAGKTSLDRLVSAIASKRAAAEAHEKAAAGKAAADAELAPIAQRVKDLQGDLDRLPNGAEPDLKVGEARGKFRAALQRSLEEACEKLVPVEMAAKKATKSVEVAKAAFDEADKALGVAAALWQNEVMRPVIDELTTMVVKLGTADTELAKANEAGAALAVLQQRVRDFCSRNPTVSLCQEPAKLAQQ